MCFRYCCLHLGGTTCIKRLVAVKIEETIFLMLTEDFPTFISSLLLLLLLPMNYLIGTPSERDLKNKLR